MSEESNAFVELVRREYARLTKSDSTTVSHTLTSGLLFYCEICKMGTTHTIEKGKRDRIYYTCSQCGSRVVR